MRNINFTGLGGFPLTQDTLAYMQQSYCEAIQGIAAIGGSNGPYILSGLEAVTTFPYGTGPGWIYFNGDVYYFAGIPLMSVSLGMESIGYVSETDTSLIFNDSTSHSVMGLKTIKFTSVATGTTLTSAQFLWGDLQSIYVAFGTAGRESTFSTHVVNTGAGNGTVTGTLYYKKNNIANTLQIYGTLTAASAQDFPSAGSGNTTNMGTLPAGYRVARSTPFTSFVVLQPLDDLGTDYLRSFICLLQPSGEIDIEWIKPASGITGMEIVINAIVPLD